MKHVYIRRNGDREKLFKYRDVFEAYSNKKLRDSYNRSVDIGIVGSHEQALHLIAIRMVFNNRFGKCPIKIKDNILICLSGKIIQESESYSELLYVKLHLSNEYLKYVHIDSIVDSDSDFINVKPLTRGDTKAILIRCTHSNINTLLNLTDVTPYVVIYFDETLAFKGASYSIKSGEGSLMIQTQYKNILLVKLPLDYELNTILKLDYEH